MELKTLWLGLVLSLAAFAIKTGLGWAYIWRAGGRGRRWAAACGVFALYGALFTAVAALVAKINLLAHYETLLPLWRHGLYLHWLTALMLCLWGLILLRRSGGAPSGADCHAPSRGWLALVIPCPVCLSVILMSVATMGLYFPEKAAPATAAMFAAFMLIAALGGGLALALTTGKGSPLGGAAPENTLGLAMLLVAAYFMLSALIAPQFSELGRVYRISAFAADMRAAQPGPRLLTTGAIGLLLLTGFLAANFFRGKQK
jgi:predicted transporter